MTISTERPTPPGEYECCESGCSPCVWDTYYEELNAWNAAQMAAKAEQAAAAEPAEEVVEHG